MDKESRMEELGARSEDKGVRMEEAGTRSEDVGARIWDECKM